jgi:hypothetical protein
VRRPGSFKDCTATENKRKEKKKKKKLERKTRKNLPKPNTIPRLVFFTNPYLAFINRIAFLLG